jgi:hypothetical protein
VGRNGLPFFDFNGFTAAGFSEDYNRAKMLFKARGVQ